VPAPPPLLMPKIVLSTVARATCSPACCSPLPKTGRKSRAQRLRLGRAAAVVVELDEEEEEKGEALAGAQCRPTRCGSLLVDMCASDAASPGTLCKTAQPLAIQTMTEQV
jgi:hypothetical protein